MIFVVEYVGSGRRRDSAHRAMGGGLNPVHADAPSPPAGVAGGVGAAQRGIAKTRRIPIKAAQAPGVGQAELDSRARVAKRNVGQHLQPRPGNLAVLRYARPEQFDALAEQAKSMGFTHAACGPLVRSSYHADEQAIAAGI